MSRSDTIQKIQEYILEMRKKGFSLEEISNKLKESGHDKSTIEKATSNFQNKKNSKQNKKLYYIILVFIIIIIISLIYLSSKEISNGSKPIRQQAKIIMSEKLSDELNIDPDFFDDQMYLPGAPFYDAWDRGCNIDFGSALVNFAHIKKNKDSLDIKCVYENIHDDIINSIEFKDSPNIYKGIILNCNKDTAFLIDNALKSSEHSCSIAGMENIIPELDEYYFLLFACKKSKINFTYSEAQKSHKCFRQFNSSTTVQNMYSLLPLVFDPLKKVIYT